MPAPVAGVALLRVEARPIQPFDQMFIRGRYRIKPQRRQIAGLEGGGIVVAAGPGAPVAIGCRVAFRWPGSWAGFAAVPMERLQVAPPDIDFEAVAQFSLNPVTAWALLDELRLESGDWVAVNAATSAIAGLARSLARARGVRILDIVRPGGAAIVSLLPALRQGATIVSYGALGPGTANLSNADMIYRNLCWKGFGIDHWLSSSKDRHATMADELWASIRSGTMALPVRARHRLANFQQAIADAGAGRAGKVLISDKNAGG